MYLVVVQIFVVPVWQGFVAVDVQSGPDAVHEGAGHGLDHEPGQVPDAGLDLFHHLGAWIGCSGLAEHD